MTKETRSFIKEVSELEANGFTKEADIMSGYSKKINDTVKLNLSHFPHNVLTFQLIITDANYQQENENPPDGMYICSLWNLDIRSWEDINRIITVFETCNIDLPDVEYI